MQAHGNLYPLTHQMAKVFYHVREVAQILGEPASTLKHWEREFPHVKPKYSAGGTRRYVQKDIDDLKLIKHLIRDKGLTIPGAREALSNRRDELERRADILARLKDCAIRLRELHAKLAD